MVNRILTVSLGLMVIMLLLMTQKVEAKELNVVSTNSILADWVRQVGGAYIEQTVLVGANGDTHTFDPTPEDSIVLTNADAIFEFGLHLEPWLDTLYDSSGSKAPRVRVTSGLMLLRSSQSVGGEVEFDPHVWHDVGNAIIMVEAIRDALMTADPAHANIYRDNAEKYLKELSSLQDRVFKEIATLHKDRRKLVTSHDTFGYFARRYGFEVIGAVIDSATTEASDPSALKMAELVRKVKASGVPAVFMENVSNPQSLQALARETGVRVAPGLYSDALGEPGSAGEDYISMMTYNVKTIVEALR